MADLGFFLTATGLIVLTILFGIFGFGLVDVGQSKNARKWLKVLTVLSLVGAIFMSGALGTLAPSAPATARTATYDTVVGDGDVSQPYMVPDNDHNKVGWNVAWDTSDGAFLTGTSSGEVNFTISRTDSSSADAVTNADLGTVDTVSDLTGNGKVYSILARNADGSYKATWEKGPNGSPATSRESTTVLLEGGSTNFVRLNATLNADALANMATYDSATFTVIVAGEVFSFDVLKATVQA